MSYQEIIDNLKPELKALEDSFKRELMKLRAGRLSPGLVEDITADCFGQPMLVKQLGSISSISPRELLLQVWDKSYVEGVVKAIEQEEMGLSVRIDDNKIFLSSPPLSEETRKNLIQLLSKKKEDVFQEIRRLRDRAWRTIQDGFQRGEVREDDKYKGKDKLDEVTREYRDRIEEMTANKEREIHG